MKESFTIFSILRDIFRKSPFTIAAIILCAFLFMGFGAVVDEVLEGDSHALDEKILLSLRDPTDAQSPLGPPWLEEMMRDFTALGGIALLALITTASVVYLWVSKQRGYAIYLTSVTITATILSNIMKLGFDRPRPDLVPHHSITYMPGFPSGHSFMAAVVYLSLGVILAEAHQSKAIKAYLITLSILIAVLVGISRVYLGVHWPSDVLAGWLVGAGWALLFWILAKYLESRRILPQDDLIP